MESRLMSLYTQVEELLDKMATVLPYVDLSAIEVNDEYIDEVSDTLYEFDDYVDYLSDVQVKTDWE